MFELDLPNFDVPRGQHKSYNCSHLVALYNDVMCKEHCCLHVYIFHLYKKAVAYALFYRDFMCI